MLSSHEPDLIMMLDAESGEPITTEEMRYGFRVTVIAPPAIPLAHARQGSHSSGRATSATTSTTSRSRTCSGAGGDAAHSQRPAEQTVTETAALKSDASWALKHELVRPRSIAEAVAALSEAGDDAAPLAGATWIMRAPQRGERMKRLYVALRDLEELHVLEPPGRIGALVTHSRLAAGSGLLAEAARLSGPPAVRNLATVGGSICARPFPESDLVPALLALDSELTLVHADGEETVALADYLDRREASPPNELVTAVALGAASGWPSAYERLTVRAGSEYPLAAAAVTIKVDGGHVADARVVVGSVERAARRIPEAEQALLGRRAIEAAADAGRAAAEAVTPRDTADGPGWYRQAVLPTLVERAIARISGANDG